MKNLTFTLVLLFGANLSMINAQNVEKTLVKSFNLKGNTTVVFELPGTVNVKKWSNNYMRILVHIDLEKANKIQLKRLVAAGRYQLSSLEIDGTFVVSTPKDLQDLKINGVEILENLTFEVELPNEVSFKNSGGDSSQNLEGSPSL